MADIAVVSAGRCIRAERAGRGATFTVAVPGGSRVSTRASADAVGRVRLGHDLRPSLALDLDLAKGRAVEVAVPDVGDGRPWRLAFDLPSAEGTVIVCARVEAGRADRATTINTSV